MQLTKEQFEIIEPYFPKQRGNVNISNLTVMNALLHVMYEGCTWRRLPEKFGPWHTIYMRWNRWCKKGVMSSVFNALQENGIIPNSTEFAELDSTIIPVHKHGTGAKKTRQSVHRQEPRRKQHENSRGLAQRRIAPVLDVVARSAT